MLMEIDISDYTCGDTYEMGKDSSSSPKPVPLCASGQGLPYAPVDFPNPGDIWAWKVGNKISPLGYYMHRYLLVPKSLQKSPTRKIWLGSRLAITRFLQSEFPNADIDAFFASFTWKIPAEKTSAKKGKTIAGKKTAVKKTAAKKKTSSSKAIKKKQAKSESQITMRTRNSTRNSTSVTPHHTTASIDMNSPPNQIANATPIHSQNDHNAPTCGPHSSKSLADRLAEMSSEEFELYLNSLDETLANSAPKAINSQAQIEDFTKARDELSSLLSIGLPSIISSNKLLEIQNLSSKLKSDPYLTQDEQSMLNLIHEIPSASKELTEAFKSSVGTEGNADDIISLKIQYMLCKDRIALLQAEDASASTSIQEIDQEMAKLQSRRAKLAKGVVRNQKKIAELLSTQNQVFDSVAKIADVAPVSGSRVSQRQMKQKGVSKQGAEILAKFAPLKGFSFRR